MAEETPPTAKRWAILDAAFAVTNVIMLTAAEATAAQADLPAGETMQQSDTASKGDTWNGATFVRA